MTNLARIHAGSTRTGSYSRFWARILIFATRRCPR
jgi:hypothetical protein